MDYKQKYEKALEYMHKVYPTLKGADKEDAEHHFPELKEGEDERMRKEILEYFQQFENEELRGVNISDWIAWLEKQDKNEEINEASYRAGIKRVLDNPESYGLEKQREQKSAWSEEDDYIFKNVYELVKENEIDLNRRYCVEDCLTWLKSLKERYSWKPSEKQMNQLGWIAEQNKDNIIGKELMSFYQDLKKLREE